MQKILLFSIVSIFILISISLILWILLPDFSELKKETPKITALMRYRIKESKTTREKLVIYQKWKSLEEISPYLVSAVLISEDDRFFAHYGIDWTELKEALKKEIRKKRFVRGASTVTQQVARNLYLSPQKTIWRKILEVLIALKMEVYLPKRRILEIYLNIAEWGKGIFGAEAASQWYFKKRASELTPHESASLASILPNPIKYSPFSESRFVKKRRERILKIMERRGIIIH